MSMCAQLLSRVQLFAAPWTLAHQAPPSMRLPRQEYWSGLPFPLPGDLPDPEISLVSPTLQVHSLPTEPSVCVLVARSCPTLCNPMYCSSPSSSVHGILQARILEWIAIPFSRHVVFYPSWYTYCILNHS